MHNIPFQDKLSINSRPCVSGVPLYTLHVRIPLIEKGAAQQLKKRLHLLHTRKQSLYCKVDWLGLPLTIDGRGKCSQLCTVTICVNKGLKTYLLAFILL